MRPWEPGSKTDYDQKKSEIHKQIEASFHPSKGKALSNRASSLFYILMAIFTLLISIPWPLLFISLCLFFKRTPDMWQSHISIFCLCPEAAEIYITQNIFPLQTAGFRDVRKISDTAILAAITMHPPARGQNSINRPKLDRYAQGT